MSTLKPWETKTVDKLTQEEILKWVEFTLQRNIPGRKPWQVASDIVHNVLLWERAQVAKTVTSSGAKVTSA
jgi:hypothetical protein